MDRTAALTIKSDNIQEILRVRGIASDDGESTIYVTITSGSLGLMIESVCRHYLMVFKFPILTGNSGSNHEQHHYTMSFSVIAHRSYLWNTHATIKPACH